MNALFKPFAHPTHTIRATFHVLQTAGTLPTRGLSQSLTKPTANRCTVRACMYQLPSTLFLCIFFVWPWPPATLHRLLPYHTCQATKPCGHMFTCFRVFVLSCCVVLCFCWCAHRPKHDDAVQDLAFAHGTDVE